MLAIRTANATPSIYMLSSNHLETIVARNAGTDNLSRAADGMFSHDITIAPYNLYACHPLWSSL